MAKPTLCQDNSLGFVLLDGEDDRHVPEQLNGGVVGGRLGPVEGQSLGLVAAVARLCAHRGVGGNVNNLLEIKSS